MADGIRFSMRGSCRPLLFPRMNPPGLEINYGAYLLRIIESKDAYDGHLDFDYYYEWEADPGFKTINAEQEVDNPNF